MAHHGHKGRRGQARGGGQIIKKSKSFVFEGSKTINVMCQEVAESISISIDDRRNDSGSPEI